MTETFLTSFIPSEPEIIERPQNQLYTHEHLENLVALLYDTDIRSILANSLYSVLTGQVDKTTDAELKAKKDDLFLKDEFQNTLKDALEAVQQKLIRTQSKDGYINPDNGTYIHTVDFMFWAIAKGFQLSEKVKGLLEHAYQSHTWEVQSRQKEIDTFPQLAKDEFEKRKRQPLWFMYDALLYAMGLDNKSEDIDYISNYLKKFDYVLPVLEQIKDAVLIKQIELHSDHVDKILSDDKQLLLSKIRPDQFVNFLTSITEVPFITGNEGTKTENELSAIPLDQASYTTPETDMILAVMEKFWSEHKIWGDEAYSKSESADVIEAWIMDEGKRRGYKIAKHIAQAIQIISRPVSARGSGRK